MNDSERKKPWYALSWNLILWGLVIGIILYLCC